MLRKFEIQLLKVSLTRVFRGHLLGGFWSRKCHATQIFNFSDDVGSFSLKTILKYIGISRFGFSTFPLRDWNSFNSRIQNVFTDSGTGWVNQCLRYPVPMLRTLPEVFLSISKFQYTTSQTYPMMRQSDSEVIPLNASVPEHDVLHVSSTPKTYFKLFGRIRNLLRNSLNAKISASSVMQLINKQKI